ncbi:TPR domain protein [Sulfuriferula multivorans]|uniref:TPR domain protein n=1 Tax=Sulfuriferula multivorans TaxID=1559896 RepID=A0A401JCE9_9PROT|nr:XrtA/PEP-CTERM system TPR-repeat protein PrsT [Sulfuriferula multivorans]GBL45331.1 TPR domain protein [Sulfuriferula multivorans]
MPSISRLHIALLLTLFATAACGDSTSKYLSEAKQLQAKGDDKAAIIQLKNVLQKDDKNAEARYLLGTAYNRSGDYASAEKELRRARDAGYSPDKVVVALAEALQGQGAYQRVIEEITLPQGASGPLQAQILVARGNAELGLNEPDKAGKLFNEALKAAPSSASAHLGLARIAAAKGSLDSALGEIENALKLAPTDRDAWLMKADLLRLKNQPEAALAAYREAIKSDPTNSAAHLSIASIYLASNKFAEARQEIEAARKLNPNNLSVRYMQALVDFRGGKLDAARDNLQEVLKSAPEYPPALLLSAAVNYAQGSYEQAASQLGKVLEKAPANAYARKLLAATQAKLGQSAQALATLQPLKPEESNDPQLLALAGDLYLHTNNFTKANQLLEKAASIDPKSASIRTGLGVSRLASGDTDRALADLESAATLDTGAGAHKADTLLILTLMRDKKYDRALQAIADLDKKQPNSPITYNLRGGAYLGKKDLSNARKSFEQALAINPDFFPAAANLAQLDLQANNPAAARKRFETLLQHDANNAQAMLALAQLSARAGQEKDYLSWLERAAKTAPDALQPRLLLADYYLRKNDFSKALVLAREARTANPGNPAALDMLGNAQLAAGDKDNALASFQKLAEMAPQSPAVQVRIANAQLALKQTDKARAALNRALQIKPDFLDAQTALIALDIQGKHYDQAIQMAHKVQQQLPRAPVGWVLEGDTLLMQKQPALALQKYETAWRLQNSGPLAVKLHNAKVLSGKAAEADAGLLVWLKAHPDDAASRAYLAQSAMERGNYKLANTNYATLLEKSPNNILILNNYAWSLQRAGDARALDYAERAYKLAPDNTAVMDTLAEILMTRGQTGRAIQLFRQALSKSPDSTEIEYHYIQALAKSGDTARARSELERLLASGAAFSHESEARTLLKQLQGKTN